MMLTFLNGLRNPAHLSVKRIQLRNRKEFPDETEKDYLDNYEVMAGETINIYPVIRCTFGEANNIKMKLETDEYEDPDAVQVETDEVDFGWQLDAGGMAVSKNPLVLHIPSDIADSRHIRMKISAFCEGQEGTATQSIILIATNMETISGEITENRILSADHAYYVNDYLQIDEGVTLTIEPGARLEFAKNRGLTSMGKLVVNGTPENPILFTSHNGGETWGGVSGHSPKNGHRHNSVLYTNNDSTLFTLLPTEITPTFIDSFWKYVYYGELDNSPGKSFSLSTYLGEEAEPDMTNREELLTDPNFLTSAVLEMLNDWKSYCSKYPTEPTEDKTNSSIVSAHFFYWYTYDDPIDTISYCIIENSSNCVSQLYMKDCVIKGSQRPAIRDGIRNLLTENTGYGRVRNKPMRHSNIINNDFTIKYATSISLPKYSDFNECNYFNSPQIFGNTYYLAIESDYPTIDKSRYPSYLGTSREEYVRPYIYELGNSATTTWGTIDLSNMRKEPVPEAHGIVWKVVVNGKDAQDEYEDLAPLGVGKHKFEVYFNRPMNKNVTPLISFGIRDPWTQNGVDEDGSWNEEGTIYTAYKTITGKTKSDGVNRIYVRGAEDNEFFPCPYEKSRFNINVQAAGSMATGFAAEASLGRVILTWDNSQNNIEDAMGYNVYRIVDTNINDTIRINEDILGIETSEYIDCAVEPGHTYYYLYKVLSTDLKEYDISNVVAATPLTATLGDANGSGEVDVLDVVTTVNYAMGLKPEPFIFDAADMNADKSINILDVIGIVQKILYPNAVSTAAVENLQAVYTIEDGVLYVESPVALAGVQAQVNSLTPNPSPRGEGSIAVASDLDGFEHASAWLSENDMLFLAYSMNGKTLTPGKHALLYIGDGELSSLRLADVYGHNVEAVAGEGTTAVDAMGSKVQTQGGVFNLKGQKVAGKASDLQKLPKGVYIINGQKVVK